MLAEGSAIGVNPYLADKDRPWMTRDFTLATLDLLPLHLPPGSLSHRYQAAAKENH